MVAVYLAVGVPWNSISVHARLPTVHTIDVHVPFDSEIIEERAALARITLYKTRNKYNSQAEGTFYSTHNLITGSSSKA